MLAEFAEQEYRMGNFSRIFPLSNNIEYYSHFIEPRARNQALWERMEKGDLYKVLAAKFGAVQKSTVLL